MPKAEKGGRQQVINSIGLFGKCLPQTRINARSAYRRNLHEKRGDPYWSVSGIRRIVENLCGNAIKYGALAGPVTISLLRHGSAQVQIEVHNEGPTITLEDQLNMFQPFRRNGLDTLEKEKGWGLGLTVVRGIAEAHSGTVEVESLPARGTTFRVTLPLDARSSQ